MDRLKFVDILMTIGRYSSKVAKRPRANIAPNGETNPLTAH
jgi:hypothetical protein